MVKDSKLKKKTKNLYQKTVTTHTMKESLLKDYKTHCERERERERERES